MNDQSQEKYKIQVKTVCTCGKLSCLDAEWDSLEILLYDDDIPIFQTRAEAEQFLKTSDYYKMQREIEHGDRRVIKVRVKKTN